MGQVVHSIITAIVIVSAGLLAYFFTPVVHAQTVASPYWCGSYWSSTPCNYGGYNTNSYGNGYYSNQYPQYQYQTYPNNYYYPNNYNNYYPNQNYQYYYPAPTCSITYSYTNNPNYWSGGMYSQAIQISWSSSYASSAYITGIGATSASGVRVVYPYGYTQYSMTVYGPGGSNSCSTYYQPQQYYPQQQYNWNQYYYNPGYQY